MDTASAGTHRTSRKAGRDRSIGPLAQAQSAIQRASEDLLVEAELELPLLLRRLIEEARSMTGARHGALCVLNDERTALAEFITAGLEPIEEERVGPAPVGRGVLGALVSDGVPLRLPCLGDHPARSGFPPNRPPMASFLGVPIKVCDDVLGNLYLTDKVGCSDFTDEDKALVTAFAVAAGIVIEGVHLHRRVELARLTNERERVGRELRDTVIYRIFSAGLKVQGIVRILGPGNAADRLQSVVSDIDGAIRELRSTIFDLALYDGKSEPE